MSQKALRFQESNINKWGTIYLIGHSLGAHISGYAAKLVRDRKIPWTVQRITGLDPAWPCFTSDSFRLSSTLHYPLYHLDKTDAPFVDVIHTSGRGPGTFGLGIFQPIGRFYVYNHGFLCWDKF